MLKAFFCIPLLLMENYTSWFKRIFCEIVQGGGPMMEHHPASSSGGIRGFHNCRSEESTTSTQVCSLTHFFSLLFVKKIFDLSGGQINGPSLGRILFSFVPHYNSLVLVFDPSWDFWADKAPFIGPQSRLVSSFWNFRDTWTPSGFVMCGKSHNSVKNNWHKPWLFYGKNTF